MIDILEGAVTMAAIIYAVHLRLRLDQETLRLQRMTGLYQHTESKLLILHKMHDACLHAWQASTDLNRELMRPDIDLYATHVCIMESTEANKQAIEAACGKG
ncbi:MAG: hypothetical protein AAF607_03890 [Pseudomonadota bacterium]